MDHINVTFEAALATRMWLLMTSMFLLQRV